jgi:hypothetical protein
MRLLGRWFHFRGPCQFEQIFTLSIANTPAVSHKPVSRRDPTYCASTRAVVVVLLQYLSQSCSLGGSDRGHEQ